METRLNLEERKLEADRGAEPSRAVEQSGQESGRELSSTERSPDPRGARHGGQGPGDPKSILPEIKTTGSRR